MAASDYLSGFGNEHETEAVAGALPRGQFSPQRAPFGLYAEKFSTTAFTAPRHANRRTWFYRIVPSVSHSGYELHDIASNWLTAPHTAASTAPDPMRWDPLPIPSDPVDFVAGMFTMAANGDVLNHIGVGVHCYLANHSMDERFFVNADGEMLIVPQQGRLAIRTECGELEIAPKEVAVIPRGLKFQVQLLDGTARGFVAENYGACLELPERGPVGSDGFANDRDFLYPRASYEDRAGDFQLVTKLAGNFYRTALSHSPLDVVAWVGNSAPYKYDLDRFNTIGSISYDHPDPSIFTVLSSPSTRQGVANLDFVIFPPRWLVADGTFRPPWYHRNVMSEFMGLIDGEYDAKPGADFSPGGMTLHNCMTPHGPDATAYEQATTAALSPQKIDATMAFMFESRLLFRPTDFALDSTSRQTDYPACWQDLARHFRSPG